MNALYKNLRVIAGPSAAAKIRRDGLTADQVSAVFGASGAAKWLGICGLDQAVFGHFLRDIEHEVLLYGTSVGAFKLASACRRDAHAALQIMADAYITQTYPDGAGADAIDRESNKILDVIFGGGGATEILNHPHFRFSCGTVLLDGLMGSDNKVLQYAGAARAMLTNGMGRNVHSHAMSRVVFADPRADFPIKAQDKYGDTQVPLDEMNLSMAVKASGSIPIMMHPVRDIAGGPKGTYVDGGVVDYHPVPGWFWQDDGLILYPHFYPYLKSGWFDKYYRRVAPGSLLDNVVLLAPSDTYLQSLDLGRVPDRKDFKLLQNDDAKRIALWRDAADKSNRLGEAFLELVRTGDIAGQVEVFGD